MLYGLIGWFFDVTKAGIQSIHAVPTVGIKFALKLILSVAMVAVLLIQHVGIKTELNQFQLNL